MPDALSPQNLAFIICDSIIEDRETGKKTLVGIFNRVNARTFPVRHAALSVFVSLTEGRGRCQAQLQCIKSSEDDPIFEVAGPIEFQGPTEVVELGFNIRGIQFPEPGLYEFQFLCDGIPVGHRPFEVLQIGEQR